MTGLTSAAFFTAAIAGLLYFCLDRISNKGRDDHSHTVSTVMLSEAIASDAQDRIPISLAPAVTQEPKTFSILDSSGSEVVRVKKVDENNYIETDAKNGERYLYSEGTDPKKYNRFLLKDGEQVPQGYSVSEGDRYLIYDQQGNLIRRVAKKDRDWFVD